MRVRLTPAQASAGKQRVFEVIRFEYDAETRHLTFDLRDGQMCVALVGQWQLEVEPSRLQPHSIAEAERIHDERSLVLMN